MAADSGGERDQHGVVPRRCDSCCESRKHSSQLGHSIQALRGPANRNRSGLQPCVAGRVLFRERLRPRWTQDKATPLL